MVISMRVKDCVCLAYCIQGLCVCVCVCVSVCEILNKFFFFFDMELINEGMSRSIINVHNCYLLRITVDLMKHFIMT